MPLTRITVKSGHAAADRCVGAVRQAGLGLAVIGVVIATSLLVADVSLSLECIVHAAPAGIVDALTSMTAVSGRMP